MAPTGKSDMDRVGLFKEMGYISIGDKYTPFNYRPFNESAHRNRQMLSTGPKSRSALQAGYFDTQFKRVFEREALSDPVKLQRQQRLLQAKRNLGKAFLPSNGEKKPSGVGSYYGTLGGPVAAMSAMRVPPKPYKPPGKNMYSSPGKRGSGYSYPNVTLSRLELYASDPYDRARHALQGSAEGGPFRLNLHPKEFFSSNPYKLDKPTPAAQRERSTERTNLAVPFKPSSPAKRIGGMKAGTFDLYPTHSADLYVTRKTRSVATNKEGKIFHPPPGPKSTPIRSILLLNVNKVVNSSNYRQDPVGMVY